MTDFSDNELHTKPVTFMGAPYTHDLSGAKAAVLGVPFDCGVHPFRGSDPDKARLQYAPNRIWCGGIIRNSPPRSFSRPPTPARERARGGPRFLPLDVVK